MTTNGTTRKPTQATTTPATLKAGWGVAIILRQPVSNNICYVGEVQAMDERGIRITLMDWFIEAPVGMDWWVPWDNIMAMEVCTDRHHGWDPGVTQIRANHAAGLESDEKLDEYFADRRAERKSFKP